MYRKERYSFCVLFALKAACGLAYRPQAAFAFDRYLSSSQLLVRLHDDGLRRGYAPNMQHQSGRARCGGACNASSVPYIRKARACAGHRWIELTARQRVSRLDQAAELFFVRYPSCILGPTTDAWSAGSDPYPTCEPRMPVPGLLFF